MFAREYWTPNNLQPGRRGAGQAGRRASAPAAGIPGRARGAPAHRGQAPEDTAGVATAGARHRQVDEWIYGLKEVGG